MKINFDIIEKLLSIIPRVIIVLKAVDLSLDILTKIRELFF